MATDVALSRYAPRARARPWLTAPSLLALAGALLLCYGAAALGSWFTFEALDDWYAALAKPSFNPPNGVFGPVWSVLYTLMAVAAWRVWVIGRHEGRPIALALTLFAVQLVLNVAWSATFFGAHALLAALIVIAGLWLAILATGVAFWRIDRIAAVLLIPYLAWVSFASALNAAILQLNG